MVIDVLESRRRILHSPYRKLATTGDAPAVAIPPPKLSTFSDLRPFSRTNRENTGRGLLHADIVGLELVHGAVTSDSEFWLVGSYFHAS